MSKLLEWRKTNGADSTNSETVQLALAVIWFRHGKICCLRLRCQLQDPYHSSPYCLSRHALPNWDNITSWSLVIAPSLQGTTKPREGNFINSVADSEQFFSARADTIQERLGYNERWRRTELPPHCLPFSYRKKRNVYTWARASNWQEGCALSCN